MSRLTQMSSHTDTLFPYSTRSRSGRDSVCSRDDLAWLCAEGALPVIVKGVLRGDDARLCVDAGASGLIVSNHGGNQLDTAVNVVDALPAEIGRASCRERVCQYV